MTANQLPPTPRDFRDSTAMRTFHEAIRRSYAAVCSDLSTHVNDEELHLPASEILAAAAWLQGQITANAGNITALDGRLTTAESDITAAEGDIVTLQNQRPLVDGLAVHHDSTLWASDSYTNTFNSGAGGSGYLAVAGADRFFFGASVERKDNEVNIDGTTALRVKVSFWLSAVPGADGQIIKLSMEFRHGASGAARTYVNVTRDITVNTTDPADRLIIREIEIPVASIDWESIEPRYRLSFAYRTSGTTYAGNVGFLSCIILCGLAT